MYEDFYGLRDKPFSMLPDPGFLYLSKQHQTALTLLEYGLMNNVGFCVISGETGAGKTTLLRKLLERIDESYTVGMITNTHRSFGSLLDWILSAFNQHDAHLSQVEMHQKLMDFLIAEYANNKKVLLIVDEAQNMGADTLEELRMLSNVNSAKDQLMQIILAGQPALKDTLRIPELMQFAQRIGVDYHLAALNLTETCAYIQHRLLTAGASQDIFTPAACARIYSFSGGIPRLINLLCDTVMVYGFADQQKRIDVDLVDEMVQERMKDSVVPIVNRDKPRANQQDMELLESGFHWISPKTDKVAAATGVVAEPAVNEPGVDESGVDEPLVNEALVNKALVNKVVAVEPALQTEADIGADVDAIKGKTDYQADIQPVQLNKVELIQPETVKKATRHWGLYAIILLILLIVAVVVYKPGIVLSQFQQPAQIEDNDKIHRQLEQAKLQIKQQAKALQQAKAAVMARAEAERKRIAKAVKTAAVLKAAVLVKELKAAKFAAEAEQRERLAKAAIRKAKLHVQEQQRLARQAAEKARMAAKKQVQALAVQHQLMQMRQEEKQKDEARKLKQIEAARRLEKAISDKQQEAADSAKAVAATQTPDVLLPEKKTKKVSHPGCIGPAARFKSTCH